MAAVLAVAKSAVYLYFSLVAVALATLETESGMTARIRIAVIGAGLGGCAAGALLLASGHDVHLYEQAPAFGRLGAGIHLGPNVMKVLNRIGIGERLVATGVEPEAWVSRMWDTNDVLFSLPLRAVSRARYGAAYLTVHRGDFHELLTNAVPADRLHFDRRLTELDPTGNAVKLTFADGSTAEADIVIGADGVNSRVREVLLGAERPRYTGVVGHRAIFPTRLLGDVRIADFTKWWAPDRHLLVYFITHRRDEVYLVTGAPEPEWNTDLSWVPSTKAELQAVFESFHPDARRIVDLTPEDGITKWAFFERDPLPFWSRGRVVLLGDACHPMKPHMGQGAAMAIEDAAMLVRCLDHAGAGNFAEAFALYEKGRHPRTSRVQHESRSNTWLRDETDPTWVFGYDVFAEPIGTDRAA